MQGHLMTAAPTATMPRAVVPSRISLASALFSAASDLARGPSDAAYADFLLTMAFNHLGAALSNDADREAVKQCADDIAACTYLSEAVRDHVSRTIRGMEDGTVPLALALNIVSAAAARQSYQLMIDAFRCIASESLGNVADAVDGLATTETRH